MAKEYAITSGEGIVHDFFLNSNRLSWTLIPKSNILNSRDFFDHFTSCFFGVIKGCLKSLYFGKSENIRIG